MENRIWLIRHALLQEKCFEWQMFKWLNISFRRNRRKCVTVSQTGLRRVNNEDSVFADFERGVFCVADGMGGGEYGEVASRLITDNLMVMTYNRGASFLEYVQNVMASHQEANNVIIEYAKEHGTEQMGSTVATLVLESGNLGRAAVIWAGDSRVYRLRRGVLKQISRDHRLGLTNMLTRAVGIASDLRCDIQEIDVQRGDRFVLCSDGVHGVFTEVELKRLVTGPNLDKVVAQLEAAIIKRGAPDNYSFIIAQL